MACANFCRPRTSGPTCHDRFRCPARSRRALGARPRHAGRGDRCARARSGHAAPGKLARFRVRRSVEPARSRPARALPDRAGGRGEWGWVAPRDRKLRPRRARVRRTDVGRIARGGTALRGLWRVDARQSDRRRRDQCRAVARPARARNGPDSRRTVGCRRAAGGGRAQFRDHDAVRRPAPGRALFRCGHPQFRVR